MNTYYDKQPINNWEAVQFLTDAIRLVKFYPRPHDIEREVIQILMDATKQIGQ